MGLELRMYGLAIYQLHGKHMGIQFQHAVTRFSRKYQDTEDYINWADSNETSIVLQGGTTNLNPERLGTINIHHKTLVENGIECVPFYEPDLGDQMTSIAFIVDERVFNRKKYPDFGYYYNEEKDTTLKYDWWKPDVKQSEEWIDNIGGQKNYFLREYLRKLDLWR